MKKRQKVRKRQKVKTYFLPGCLAKKGKQSSPFFGGKARKNLMDAIESGGKGYPAEALLFLSPAWATRGGLAALRTERPPRRSGIPARHGAVENVPSLGRAP
jgi:hypothetical protein